MKIDRACPHCRSRLYHPISKPVPAAYGSDSPAAVLAQCNAPAGACGRMWRAVLRPHELDEFRAEMSS